MLPTITPSLPQSSALQPNGLAASVGTGLTMTAAPALTSAAVPGSSAAQGATTQTPQPRVLTQPERAAILPDPEFWKVPTREAMKAASLPPRAPLQVNVPQTTQFTAQIIAQQPPADTGEEPLAETEIRLPVERRSTSAIGGKKPSIGDARGNNAYTVAMQRLNPQTVPASVEAIS